MPRVKTHEAERKVLNAPELSHWMYIFYDWFH